MATRKRPAGTPTRPRVSTIAAETAGAARRANRPPSSPVSRNTQPQRWRPGAEASLELRWSRPPTGGFAVTLHLRDDARPSQPAAAWPVVLRAQLDARSPRLRFAVRVARSPNLHLSGCLQCRGEGSEVSLWIVDLHYPGGHTPEARLTGTATD